MSDGPLSGIRVIELSNMVTASLAAMTLAGQGADVVKVEPLGIGDKLRHFGTQKMGISGVFNNCNRGKRSVAINLKSDAGAAAVRLLVEGADILIHNYRPGVLRRLGLVSEDLRASNPKLIICSLTGFGRVGPLKDAPAFDHVVQALSGITAAQTTDDTYEFMRMLICDKITAYTAAQAVTAALLPATRTGRGTTIDISMLGASLAFMWPDGMMHKTLLADDVLHMAPMAAFYQTFPTADGHIAIAPFGDAHWAEMYRIFERPDLAADPRFSNMLTRSKNIEALMAAITETPSTRTSEDLLGALQGADIPCAPCLSQDALARDPQIAAIAAIDEQDHPVLGPTRMAANPVSFGGQPATPLGPSPTLGQHSASVLREAGLDIDALHAAGVI